MLTAICLGYFSTDYVIILMVLACVGAAAMGWLTDMLMRDSGVGIIGNSLVTLGGMALTLMVWNSYVGQITSSEPLAIIAVMAAVSVLLLMGVALLKRLR
jgi:hypothetical protein